jgi:hypothetical protein
MASHNQHSLDRCNAHSTSATGQSLHIHDGRAMSASPPIATKLLRHGNRNRRLAKGFEATPFAPSLYAAPGTDRSCVMTFEPDSRLAAGGLISDQGVGPHLTCGRLLCGIEIDPAPAPSTAGGPPACEPLKIASGFLNYVLSERRRGEGHRDHSLCLVCLGQGRPELDRIERP